MLQCTRTLPHLLPSHLHTASHRTVFLPVWSNATLKEINKDNLRTDRPHINNVVDYLVDLGEKKKKRYNPQSYSKYYAHKTWHVIKQPETQRFLDNLHDKMMADREKLQKEQDEEARFGDGANQPGGPPDNLLVLDHITYIQQEELIKAEEAKMGDHQMQLGQSVNNVPTWRNPYHIMKNHGIKAGAKDLKDVGLSQAMVAVSRRYKDLKDKQYTQIPTSTLLRNKHIANHLQDLYIGHFEAIRDKEWPRLYSILASQVAPYIKDQFKDKTVYWELVKVEKKPKVLSNMKIPLTDDVSVNQVLAKFTLRVKYSVLEKGKLLNKTVPLDESVVEYYVVFEKRNDDRHAKWIIVERLSKEDVDHYRHHARDLENTGKE